MDHEFLKMLPMSVSISGSGFALGGRKMDNQALIDEFGIRYKSSFVDRKIGIESRYFMAEDEVTSDMAAAAAQKALDNAGLTIDDISRLIVGTSSPDHLSPNVACIIQHKLGGTGFPAMDVNATCCGFVYAFDMAARAVATGDQHVLVIGADCRSRYMNINDTLTTFLYGDGAGAVIVSRGDKSQGGLIKSVTYADGSGWDAVYIPAGGTAIPVTEEAVRDNLHKVCMADGPKVAENAKNGFIGLTGQVLEGTGYDLDDVDFFAFHQPNLRLLEAVRDELGIPEHKTHFNFKHYGNTVAGCIPIVLSEAHQLGKIKKGDLVLLCGVGGGFTGGAHLLRWNC